MYHLLIIIISITVLLLYMLIIATGSASVLASYYWQLFSLNTLLIFILLSLVLRQLWVLWKDIKDRVFGARLTKRLVGMFSWLVVLPSIFLFAVSGQFISYSINSWFGNDTEEALERSLNLSKLSLENTLKDSVENLTKIQVELLRGLSMEEKVSSILEEQAFLDDFVQIAVYDIHKLDWIFHYRVDDAPKLPIVTVEEIAEIMSSGVQSKNISYNNVLLAEMWIRIPPVGKTNYLLFARQATPKSVADDAVLIESARAKYAELTYSKEGMQTFFLMTLIMATLLAIFMSLLVAIFFARRFIAPLTSIANATKAVTLGDFSVKSPIYKSDELGILSAQFNRMTEQLQQSKEATEKLHQEQEEARSYLEKVLASLMTGVLTFTSDGELITFNQSAEDILKFPLAKLKNINWHNWGDDSQSVILRDFVEKVLLELENEDPVEIDYNGGDKNQILLGKAASLSNEVGLIIVFDDVTDLVLAQKDAAWGEVARRLAHEIRNPLTPIQLSAERLSWKLSDKLTEEDAAMLNKSTTTIINQVAALKEMVESFKNYARSVNLKLKKIDFNELILEVLTLYESSNCTFVNKLSNMTMYGLVDITSMRQVLHNIFKNAAEAALEGDAPLVVVSSFVENGKIIILVENSGLQFSPDILNKAFDPYVTNKFGGTGLGLAVVKKIVEEHEGEVTLGNKLSNGGAWVKIALPYVEME